MGQGATQRKANLDYLLKMFSENYKDNRKVGNKGAEYADFLYQRSRFTESEREIVRPVLLNVLGDQKSGKIVKRFLLQGAYSNNMLTDVSAPELLKLRLLEDDPHTQRAFDDLITYVQTKNSSTNPAGTNTSSTSHPAMKTNNLNSYGGIDLNSINLNLQINAMVHGVPLPLAQQDMARLMEIQGFIPILTEINPAVNLPIISEIQQKLQVTSSGSSI